MSPNQLEGLRAASEAKLARMKAEIAGCGSAVVAFSAGVDSTFVLAVAREVLGAGAVALTAHSPSVPQASARRRAPSPPASAPATSRWRAASRTTRATSRTARPLLLLQVRALPALRGDREGGGPPHVLDGFNADDRRDHRPGHQAAVERSSARRSRRRGSRRTRCARGARPTACPPGTSRRWLASRPASRTAPP